MSRKGKMRMFSLAAVLCGLTVMLTGCHGARGLEAFAIPEEFDETKTYTITFWAKNDTNKTQTEIYQKAIADFEKIYPNIVVNMRLYTNYGDIYNDVITNISTGTTPNVCITYPDHIATYLTGANIVIPLDELIADADYGLGGRQIRFDGVTKEEVIPQFLQEGVIGDHHYAMPFMRSTEACYVNKTMVEKLGYTLPEMLTWDFVWEVSEAAMEKGNDGNYLVNGQNVLIPFIYKSTDNMMIQMLKQAGGEYSTEEGDILLFNDTTKKMLYTIAEHGKSRAFSTFQISSYPANFFNAGQCIFAVDSTAGATWMGTDAPLCDISRDKVVDFETAVMEVPQFDVEHPQMISQGPSVCVFNKRDSQEVLASWLFVQYLLSNEVQIAYSETEGYLPVTLKAQNSAEYQDYLQRSGEDNHAHYEVKIKASRLLMEHTGDTFVTPVFNGSASLRSGAGQLIENAVKTVRRGGTMDEASMEKLFADVRSLYRLNQGGSAMAGKEELGALPGTAVILLSALVVVWIFIILYVIAERKNRKTI